MRAELGQGEEAPSPPPQRGLSAKVSRPVWVCCEMIASSRGLAAFSQNATARKSQWILQGPRSKKLMDETSPISPQPNGKKALGFNLRLGSRLSSEYISVAANAVEQ